MVCCQANHPPCFFNPTPDPSPEGRGDATNTVEYTGVRSTSPLPSGVGSGVGLWHLKQPVHTILPKTFGIA